MDGRRWFDVIPGGHLTRAAQYQKEHFTHKIIEKFAVVVADMKVYQKEHFTHKISHEKFAVMNTIILWVIISAPVASLSGPRPVPAGDPQPAPRSPVARSSSI